MHPCSIAIVLKEQGQYDVALDWYKKALATRVKLVGDNHLDTAQTYNKCVFTLCLFRCTILNSV